MPAAGERYSRDKPARFCPAFTVRGYFFQAVSPENRKGSSVRIVVLRFDTA
jgi:hypothetical protein